MLIRHCYAIVSFKNENVPLSFRGTYLTNKLMREGICFLVGSVPHGRRAADIQDRNV